jgi:acyl carrier protein
MPRGHPLQSALLQISEGIVSASNAAAPGSSAPIERSALEAELATLLVQALNLELVADEIDPTASLFNEGLGLDSIDVLELALEVSQRYGFQLRADDENNHAIFQSLRTLAAHVAQHRTR